MEFNKSPRSSSSSSNWRLELSSRKNSMFFVLLLLQRDHSNRMPCSYRKVVYSITFTMHRDAGHSLDGIKLVRLPVKTVACKCVALLCCYHAAFHYSRALNSYAVQSISKVSFLFCFALCVCHFVELVGELIKRGLGTFFFLHDSSLSHRLFHISRKQQQKKKRNSVVSMTKSFWNAGPHYTRWRQFIAAWSKHHYTPNISMYSMKRKKKPSWRKAQKKAEFIH